MANTITDHIRQFEKVYDLIKTNYKHLTTVDIICNT